MALILTFSQREKGLRGISCITPMTVNQNHQEQVLVPRPVSYDQLRSRPIQSHPLARYFWGSPHPPQADLAMGFAPLNPRGGIPIKIKWTGY